MKREISESVADAIGTIKSFCDGQLNYNCDGCPFYYSTTNIESSCLFNRVCPSCWNINEEKHYYIEYGRMDSE